MATRTRQTAAERRETVLTEAMSAFAVSGFHGTRTEDIAKRAGISHAYVFRLFPTKKDLFLACVDRCFDRTEQTFRDAIAAAPPEDPPGQAMGKAYVEMLENRDLLLFQLQTYAASEDPDVRAKGRQRYQQLHDVVAELRGDTRDDTLEFIGQGMLLNVAAALGFPADDWLWEKTPRA